MYVQADLCMQPNLFFSEGPSLACKVTKRTLVNGLANIYDIG